METCHIAEEQSNFTFKLSSNDTLPENKENIQQWEKNIDLETCVEKDQQDISGIPCIILFYIRYYGFFV